MEKYKLWNFQTELDREGTKKWYDTASPWGCDCGDCRNFLEAVKRGLLPTELRNTLGALGIPPEKATYVCEMYEKGDKHCYQFSYRIRGNILEEAEKETQAWGDIICHHEIYPYGAPDFPAPHFDLEFWVDLPWVLEEEGI